MRIYILIGVIVVLLIIGLIIFIKYIKVKDLFDRLNSSKRNISSLLGKKINLINCASKVMENTYNIEMTTIRKKNLNNDFDIELDKNVKLIHDEFESIVNDNEKLSRDEKIMEFQDELKDVDEDILGLKQYYNDNAKLFNKLFDDVICKMILKIKNVKKVQEYDTKKMAELEILKN